MPEALDLERFPPRVDGRIPSLDGLRAVAVFLVIVSHLTGGLYSFPLVGTGRFENSYASGMLGVHIFFVLSGFLITTLLLLEQEKNGRISLRQFYIRRALRILPASYVFLCVMLLATWAGLIAIPKSSFLASFFYFRNYVGQDWYTGHLWSLSVEEQFYLLWPAVMVLLGKRKTLIAAFCTLPVADFMHVFHRPLAAFEVNMDALACGCILACMWGPLGRSARWQAFLRSMWFWILPVLLIALNEPQLDGRILTPVSKVATNVLIAIAVERFVRYHMLASARFLSLRWMVFAGTLSYSLYLWQEPWLVMNDGHGILQSFPLNVVLACGCALLSYTLVERPFLRLKDKHKVAVV